MKDIFRKCGKVTYTDAHQRIGEGRGEVCFDSADDLKHALKEMQGFDINGRKIEVFKTHVSTLNVEISIFDMPLSIFTFFRATMVHEVDHEAVAEDRDLALDQPSDQDRKLLLHNLNRTFCLSIVFFLSICLQALTKTITRLSQSKPWPRSLRLTR